MYEKFVDKTAQTYDCFMRKDLKKYKQRYALIFPFVRYKNVLKPVTGTIAKNIVQSAASIEVTDAFSEMISQIMSDCRLSNIYFSVQGMFSLPYAECIKLEVGYV